MKKTTLISLMAMAFILVACVDTSTGESTRRDLAAKAGGKTVVPATKQAAEKKVAKEESAPVVKEAEKAEETTQEAVAKEVKEPKEKVEAAAEVKEEASEAVSSVDGAALYAKCGGCHGQNGEKKAMGKSEVVAGQPVADLITMLNEYKAGTRNVSGMGTLMTGQVSSMSDDEIKAVSEYMSGM